jgi:RNA polymerase sigma-70 factor, ECF subfamily
VHEQEWLAEQFEEHRARLRGLAFRLLGSAAEAEDAVQETWLRLSRSQAGEIANLGGWLTTVASRVCLDALRERSARKEEPLCLAPAPASHDPQARQIDPEQEAITADAVGLALLVVLDRLTPAERIAFVLHDLFGVPFPDIGPVVGRNAVAAKKLASRARAKVRGGKPPDADLSRRWHLVEVFLAALREGDMGGLLAILDPDVVRRADPWAAPPGTPAVLRGAESVTGGILAYGRTAVRYARLALIDGSPGLVVAPHGQLRMAIVFGVRELRIVEISVIAEPARLAGIEVTLPVRGTQ